MSIEAMKQALEALEYCKETYRRSRCMEDVFNEAKVDQDITALRTAIEQAEQQEPVLWRVRRFGSPHWMIWDRNPYEVSDSDQFDVMPLYGKPLL